MTPPAKKAKSTASAASSISVKHAHEPAQKHGGGENPAAPVVVERLVVVAQADVVDQKVQRQRDEKVKKRLQTRRLAVDEQVAY